jgi:hypothetical protein
MGEARLYLGGHAKALDINDDGKAEVFARCGGGASTETVRVLTFFECRMATLAEFPGIRIGESNR